MTKRNIIRIVLATRLSGLGRLQPAAAPRIRRADPAGTRAAAADADQRQAFTLGKLAFKRCELTQKRSGATTAAYCAPFQVPENPDVGR